MAPQEAAGSGSRTVHARMAKDWQEVLADCEAGASPEEIRRELAKLKQQWLQEDDLHLVGEVCAQLLRSGVDAKTGIPFKVGSQSSVKGCPSLRVFLLEVLGTADPDLACEVGREILASTNSAEEYAVALKPLATKGPLRASNEELEGYFATMLGKPDWQSSDGLAEGLDLARNVATPAAATTLVEWLKTSPPARELGQMALDETAAAHPQLMVTLMADQPALLEGNAGLRASLLARAAVSEDAQAGMVENYLHDPAVPVQEKREFLKLFPMRSATSGYRLYGGVPAPYEQGTVVQDDQAALETVTRWKADPALGELLPEMNKLEGRLQTWVRQAGEKE